MSDNDIPPVALKVIVSVAALVVIVTLVPPTRVNVSVAVSYTHLTLPTNREV